MTMWQYRNKTRQVLHIGDSVLPPTGDDYAQIADDKAKVIASGVYDTHVINTLKKSGLFDVREVTVESQPEIAATPGNVDIAALVSAEVERKLAEILAKSDQPQQPHSPRPDAPSSPTPPAEPEQVSVDVLPRNPVAASKAIADASAAQLEAWLVAETEDKMRARIESRLAMLKASAQGK